MATPSSDSKPLSQDSLKTAVQAIYQAAQASHDAGISPKTFGLVAIEVGAQVLNGCVGVETAIEALDQAARDMAFMHGIRLDRHTLPRHPFRVQNGNSSPSQPEKSKRRSVRPVVRATPMTRGSYLMAALSLLVQSRARKDGVAQIQPRR